jgi:hypothetical protein
MAEDREAVIREDINDRLRIATGVPGFGKSLWTRNPQWQRLGMCFAKST